MTEQQLLLKLLNKITLKSNSQSICRNLTNVTATARYLWTYMWMFDTDNCWSRNWST